MNIRDCDIIYFTLSRVDSVYSSPAYSMAKEFAKHNRVFYINHPYSIKDFFSEIRRSTRLKRLAVSLLRGKLVYENIDDAPKNFVSIVPPLTLPINWLTPGRLYNFLYSINNRRLIKAVSKILAKFKVHSYIYINSYDPFLLGCLPPGFQPVFNIYQSIDDISQDPYTVKHGLRLEKQAAKEADLVLVTSSQLKEIFSHINLNVHVLNNAVDATIFQEGSNEPFILPEELASITNPIIAFIGNMDNLRIDFALIKAVALANLDKTVLLVGPINSQKFYDLEIQKLPNIIITGPKNIRQLPQYLKFIDVALIPFLINKLTASIYPLKVNEYLAMGKPVVSTKFSVDIASFKDVVYLAKGHGEFIELVKKAIDENTEMLAKQRIEIAETNTWNSRVNQFWEILDKSQVANI